MTHASLHLIDLPRSKENAGYDRAREKVVRELSELDSADSVYETGSVRHPGISDIDLLVVVDDTGYSRADPLRTLTEDERYFFTHSCFVVPTSLASELGAFVLMRGCRRLYGTTWAWDEQIGDGVATRALERQTALEFLAKNVLDLYVQLTYGALKVRVFLQHLKGVKLDLDLAEVNDDRSTEMLERAISLIDQWFVVPDSEQQVAELALELFPVMQDALAESTRTHTLYAPGGGTLPFTGNIRLEHGLTIDITHRGVRLPRLPGLDGRRQFNAQHRLNRFRMRLPMAPAAAGSYHAARFEFLRKAKAFAAERFPSYSAPIPPLFYRAL
jgi:hypothetical protein